MTRTGGFIPPQKHFQLCSFPTLWATTGSFVLLQRSVVKATFMRVRELPGTYRSGNCNRVFLKQANDQLWLEPVKPGHSDCKTSSPPIN